ncbi:MAG TPA: hypothetical protein VKA84_11405 [Gemmatimonadaceae bacterium]|nr:hypothetical protein [Gemmatimonadaceae bacterium]
MRPAAAATTTVLATLAAFSLAACSDDPTRPPAVSPAARAPSAKIVGIVPYAITTAVTDLGVLGTTNLGDRYSRAYGINDSGVVTGETTLSGKTFPGVFRWRSATGMLFTGTQGTGLDINLGGTIAGVSYSIPGGINGEGIVISPADVLTPLGFMPNDYASYADGINDAGYLVGTSDEGNPSITGYVNIGVRWNPGTLALTSYIPTLTPINRSSTLADINSSLQSVGHSLDKTLGQAGFRYTPAVGFELIKPWSSTVSVYPEDINDGGTVIGFEHSPAGTYPFRWSPALGFSYLGGGAEQGHAYGTNAAGYAVGSVGVGSAPVPAFWMPNGTRLVLPRLAGGPPACGFSGGEVQAVNSNLQMVGSDVTAGCETHAVLWQTAILYKIIVEFWPNRWPKPQIYFGADELLPFAVLANPEMDIRQIDPRVMRLGNGDGRDTPVARDEYGRLMASYQDVDRDGDLDLLMYFSQAALERNRDLTPETTALYVTGNVGGGEFLRGVTRVEVVRQ